MGLGPNAALLSPSLPDTGGLELRVPVLSLSALNRGLLDEAVPTSLVLLVDSKLDALTVPTIGVPLAFGVPLLEDDAETPIRFPLMLMFTLTLRPLETDGDCSDPPKVATIGAGPAEAEPETLTTELARFIVPLAAGEFTGFETDTSDLELMLSDRSSFVPPVPACDWELCEESWHGGVRVLGWIVSRCIPRLSTS